MDTTSPLTKARELILSLSTPDDANPFVTKMQSLSEERRQEELAKLYESSQEKAETGDVKGISIIMRVSEFFGDRSHDRKLLHYLAQAESNQGLHEERPDKLKEALRIISEAFSDANEIDKEPQQSQ